MDAGIGSGSSPAPTIARMPMPPPDDGDHEDGIARSPDGPGDSDGDTSSDPPAADVGPPQTSMQGMVLAQAYYSGPIPPPEVLRKMDEIVPGSARRIVNA